MQFDRIYKLTIGVQGKDGIVLEGKPYGDGLDISFDIIKDLTNKTNKCSLEIRNLSTASAKKIEREDSICILEVGYSEDIGLRRIFIGYILTANTVASGAERLTKLELADGQIPVRDSRVSLSYADAVSRKKCIDDCVKDMGLTVKYAEDCEFTTFANGFSFIGAARTCLDKICAGSNLQWSIQNNVVQVIKKGQSNNNKQDAIKLSYQSGLVGFVERIVKGPKKADKKKKKESKKSGSAPREKKAGWKLKCLLQPTLSPADLIYIESANVTGWFKIETLHHKGNYRGNEWYTEMEVYEIK